MFTLCSAFEFKHLPVAGGIYDQHPVLLQKFLYIMEQQRQQEKREEAKKTKGGPTPRNMSSRASY